MYDEHEIKALKDHELETALTHECDDAAMTIDQDRLIEILIQSMCAKDHREALSRIVAEVKSENDPDDMNETEEDKADWAEIKEIARDGGLMISDEEANKWSESEMDKIRQGWDRAKETVDKESGPNEVTTTYYDTMSIETSGPNE